MNKPTKPSSTQYQSPAERLAETQRQARASAIAKARFLADIKSRVSEPLAGRWGFYVSSRCGAETTLSTAEAFDAPELAAEALRERVIEIGWAGRTITVQRPDREFVVMRSAVDLDRALDLLGVRARVL